jgi:hypothetical protein
MNASFQIKEISSDSACFRESAEIVAREFVKHEPLTVAVQVRISLFIIGAASAHGLKPLITR